MNQLHEHVERLAENLRSARQTQVARAVVLAARRGSPPWAVRVPGNGQVLVRYALPREAGAGALVAELVRGGDGRRRVLATSAPSTDPSEPAGATPRRSVRIGDDDWSWLKEQGEPSTVIRDAIAYYREHHR